MEPVRVLLTCLGGRFSLNIIRALQLNRNPKIEIIGVDTNSDVMAKHFVKRFYQVPHGSDEKYIPEILRICKRERIDIVSAGADEEVMAISADKKVFDGEGIICAVDNISTIHRIIDKLKLFDYLSKHKVPMPKYKLVHNIEDVEKAADYFGYPENKFVLKPRISRGARNVHIIGEDHEGEISLKRWSNDRKYLGSKVFEYLAMEFLPGPAYDIDVLAKNGDPLCIIPRRRLWKNKLSPFSEGCIVEKNAALTDFVAKIVKLLKLNYAYDFDCGTTADGKPAIYEINPRFSGAVAASLGAGVNIPVMLVKILTKTEIPKYDVRYGTRMFPGANGEMAFSYEENTLCK